MKSSVLMLVTISLFMSCGDNRKTEDFYSYSKISYIYRLPLIEPYEITSPDNGVNWVIEFKNTLPPARGIQFLTHIAIKDSVLVVYSPRDLSFSSDHPQVWVVVDVAKKEEKVFTSEIEYGAHLKSKGLVEIKLYEINKIFENFDATNKLPPEWPRR